MKQSELEEIGARVGSAARQFASGYRPTTAQTATAASVLAAMVDGVADYGLTLADFDAVADFPRLAIQLVQQHDAQI